MVARVAGGGGLRGGGGQGTGFLSSYNFQVLISERSPGKEVNSRTWRQDPRKAT